MWKTLQERENLAKLQALVAHAGGWNISGNLDPSVDFDERVGVVQNELGLSVFFNWGVIEHNGSYSVAVIAGGWNEALVLVRPLRNMIRTRCHTGIGEERSSGLTEPCRFFKLADA